MKKLIIALLCIGFNLLIGKLFFMVSEDLTLFYTLSGVAIITFAITFALLNKLQTQNGNLWLFIMVLLICLLIEMAGFAIAFFIDEVDANKKIAAALLVGGFSAIMINIFAFPVTLFMALVNFCFLKWFSCINAKERQQGLLSQGVDKVV